MNERLYCIACGKLSNGPINDNFYICSKDCGDLHFKIRGNTMPTIMPNKIEIKSNDGKKYQLSRIEIEDKTNQ